MTSQTYTLASGSFGALASAFVIESIESVLIWIMVMAAVICCDLISGIARSLKEKTRVRFSKACRDTIAKLTVYFSLVVCASMTQVALQNDWEINKYACMFVILIEFSSVANNILSWHGYHLSFNKLMAALLKKKFELESEDVSDIIIEHKRDSKGRFVKKNY